MWPGEIVHLPKCFAQLAFHRVKSSTLGAEREGKGGEGEGYWKRAVRRMSECALLHGDKIVKLVKLCCFWQGKKWHSGQ